MPLNPVTLDDKYTLDAGYAFMTGIQALVRLPMMQRQRDLAAGHDTAGYISGYRGSPLGSYDQQLEHAAALLHEHRIIFQPGVNEDLAATACWGTQQAGLDDDGRYAGVFALWYGKGPGVDRSGDALRHANLAGTAPLGGVLALLGDDHTCESSTTAHQSEFAMVDAMIPLLNPAGVQEILDYGLYGLALSRYAGCWAALKCVHDTVEAAAVVDLDQNRVRIRLPDDYSPPLGGLNIRWPDTPLAQEQRLHDHKLEAAQAFVRANRLDRVIWHTPQARIGIVTTGKSYLDVRQALEDLGIDETAAARLGLALYKVALSWPLEPLGVRTFAAGLQLVIVVEEKRALLETQLKDILYRHAAPPVIGKHDEQGQRLFPSAGRLDTNQIAAVIATRLLADNADTHLAARLAEIQQRLTATHAATPALARTPYFCPGCPHNTSTRVPDGSKALAGIGCHYMAQWMDRATARYTQMGAEGASWVGQARFSQREHIFQNIGDGTYFHSGLLAIRAAIAAGVNITFKILYNDAVAMTGGQGMDGPLDVPRITRQVHAEGARRVVVVTDEPDKYPDNADFAPGVEVCHRDRLDAVQRELRELTGTTVLVYDQTCAAEKRRRRKRGRYPDPPQRLFINAAVCEGCGDCGVQSNCVAIVPLETAFGRKRAIDQSACNKDFSCLNGFCPSFVSVHGGTLRKASDTGFSPLDPASLPEPLLPSLERPYNIVVTGVGGSGVVTIGALLGMAAHLEGKGCSVLDMLGLAQKGGAVISHIRIAATPAALTATRIAGGGADLLLGGDLVVTAGREALATLRHGHSRALVNTQPTMTGDFTRAADLRFPTDTLMQAITRAAGPTQVDFIAATQLATALLGDSIAANLFLLGYASQHGWLPVSVAALERAIELNGVAVAMNRQALRWGRLAARDRAALEQRLLPAATPALTLTQLIEQRAAWLTDYQNAAYARRYRARIAAIQACEQQILPGSETLTRAVALNYAKLLAYKDEYEVARLYSDSAFQQQLQAQFSGDYTLSFHLAPSWLSRHDAVTGLPQKRTFGPWLLPLFRLLKTLRFLRGTLFDPFGYTPERRQERQLLSDYEHLLDELLTGLTADKHAVAVQLATLPEQIRGYGYIKMRHIDQAQHQQAKWLAAFRSPPTVMPAMSTNLEKIA